MRTATVETVSGYIDSLARALSGPCSVEKSGVGIWWLFPPSGRRIMAVQVSPKEQIANNAISLQVNNMFISGTIPGLRVISYDETGNLTDCNFFYTMFLAA